MVRRSLLDAVLSRSTGKGSKIHGPIHWAGVAAAGLTLLDQTPDADPLVVLLFAMFHDSMRRSDGHDPEHGSRAADLAAELREAGEFELDDARMDTLREALTFHDKGKTSTDPTIGVCWDSDRLNLWRLMRRPDPALLSTAGGRRAAAEEIHAKLLSATRFVWSAVMLEYARRIGGEPPIYLRFGNLPDGGRSNFVSWGPWREVGVSAYPANAREDGSYVLDFRRLLAGPETRYLASLLHQGRPLYLVGGDQVGIGGMGEPLLADARIVCEVAPDEVGVLPNRKRFRELLAAWRTLRKGGSPNPFVWLGAADPEERPAVPLIAGASCAEVLATRASEMLVRWGFPEVARDYERSRAEARARREREKREAAKPKSAFVAAFTETGAWEPQNAPVWYDKCRYESPWEETPWK